MVNYRQATEQDYAAINDFYNRSYGKNRTIEQFYWEFDQAPAGKSIYIIAEDAGKVVGTQCVIPIELINANNQTILTGKSEDTLVDPNYRGQDIFYKLYEVLFQKCLDNGIKTVWGFTTAHKPFKKMGFAIPYAHHQTVAVNNIFPAYQYLASRNKVNSFGKKVKILGLCLLSKLKTLWASFIATSLEHYILSEEHALEIEHLIEANLSNGQNTFCIKQDHAFQEWRIYKNPNYHKIHSFTVKDSSNNIVASVVLNSHANKVAYFVYALFSPQLSQKLQVNILSKITGILFKEGIVLVRNWVFDHNAVNIREIEVFKSAGHSYIPLGTGFVWKEIGDYKLDSRLFVLSRLATQGVI